MTKQTCPICGSHEVDTDEITVGTTDYPCLICVECHFIWRRNEDKK